jgi:hypothetical protein
MLGKRRWDEEFKPYLSGELVMLADPDGTERPPLPLELGRFRRLRIGLGANDPNWTLNRWGGAFSLRALGHDWIELVPEQGDLQLNGIPAQTPTRLRDRDEIACGDYRLRYENDRLTLT